MTTPPRTDDARHERSQAETAVPIRQGTSGDGSGKYDTEHLRWIDRLCDEFESHWRSNDRPRIEDFLDRSPEPTREPLLRELLALELDYRIHRRETPSREEYLSRFTPYAEMVESIFDTQRAVLELLATAPTLITKSATAPSYSPSQLGKYELLQEIGRGGMGVVYKARQTDLGRLVAVKMLLAGSHADRQDLDRFRAEAAAVARLQHPHIVQVFEVGEHEGRPFFSLEYLSGGHLGKRIAGAPQPPKAAAELVSTLALAVHHAHERGIVHRDLKPANILLETDSVGDAALLDASQLPLRPKIADFGLAKRIESNEHTRSGTVIGTASYMSPEQARGETSRIGPAADIYALGAILYELLTGRPPFRGETPWDTIAQVISEEPVPPTRLQPKVPRDLETICLKCLHKEPQRRYASAAELSADLQRYLAGRPILARPVTSAERVWKWTRRRPAVAALLAALAAALLLGLATTTGMWRLAEHRRTVADQTAREARAAIRENFIVATEHPLFQKDGMQKPREILLDKALVYFRGFADARQHDRALRADVADAHNRVGMILSTRGSLEEAAANFDKGRILLEELIGESPRNRGVQVQLAELLIHLQRVETRRGAISAAWEHQRAAVEIRSRLAREVPDNFNYQLAHARARMESGFLHHENGQHQSALQELQSALADLRTLEKTSANDDVSKALSDCLVGIGHVHWEQKRAAEAVAVYQQAVQIQEALAPRHPLPDDRNELARAYGSLGQAQEALADYDNALKSFQRSGELRQGLVDANPDVPDYRKDLALCHKNIADELIRRGLPEQSFPLREKAVEQLEIAVALSQHNVEYTHALALAHVVIANEYRRHKNLPAKALEHLQSGLALWTGLIDQKLDRPPHRIGLAEGYGALAMLKLSGQDFPSALEVYGQSNAVLNGLLALQGDDEESMLALSRNYVNMSYCLEMLGRNVEAVPLAAQATILRERLVKDQPANAEYQRLLDKINQDMAAAADLCVTKLAPLPADAPPEAALQARLKQRDQWAAWALEFPQLNLFQTRLAECDQQIAALRDAK